MDAKVEHKNETGSVQQSTEQWMCGKQSCWVTFLNP